MSNEIKKTYDRVYTNVGSYNYEPIDKIQFLLKQFEIYQKNIKVLDVGCGKGHYSRELIKNGYNNLFGIEISTVCSENFLFDIPHVNADFLEYAKQIADNQYDVCLCMDVLEHIEPVNIDKFLSNLKRISKSSFLGIANHSDIIENTELHLIQEDCFWWKEKLLNFYNDSELVHTVGDTFFIFYCKN